MIGSVFTHSNVALQYLLYYGSCSETFYMTRGIKKRMRIRNFRTGDIPSLVLIQQAAAAVDQCTAMSADAFSIWLLDPACDATNNVFVMTDDDDEMLVWGQGGTLEGVEGEIVGYTILHCQQDEIGYHLLCQGAVHPEQRRRRVGRALLGGALNRARLVSAEFEFEAEIAGMPCYFEALLPVADDASIHLARKYAMTTVQQVIIGGFQLYRGELYS
jgi:ribosomal protein S18 acetylase RimI-like enzyme